MALNAQDLIGKFKQLFSRKTDKSEASVGIGQVFGPIAGLIVFMLLAFYAINQVRVNGPMFNQIKSADSLRAEISPPPLFVVVAYVHANESYLALAEQEPEANQAAMKEFAKQERLFREAAAIWDKHNHANKDLAGSYNALIKAGDNFFNVYHKLLLPVLVSGKVEDATAGLTELRKAYEVDDQIVQAYKVQLAKEAEAIADKSSKLLTLFLIGLGLLGAAIIAVIYVFGKRQASAADHALKALERDGQANQMAVLDLLDEMGDLADGDLTVHAQVKENITGAIADSINYTIESLRGVVTEINRASEQVNAATGQAQGTSSALLAAAERQSQQITETTDAVSYMTTSIQQVSGNANQAAQVAQRSLQAATLGSQAVQNTIAGMNGIREQIQETSKRIKRLGESSQEIGEIVELISDITEQTNILALNAAIQAASAGDAGRGFTVVAEEVQRLAERSSEATKQISAIVKTIQTDTNSAVAAMEKSTEGVVEGARLSDAAGKALTEIETVTNNLARLIQSISTATEAQTEAASQVTKNMQQIQQITSQTTEGTKQTAASVGQLTSLAAELRQSVSGFKLS